MNHGAHPVPTDPTATFPTDVAGLDDAAPTPVEHLEDGDVYALRIAPVAKDLRGDRVRMLAYNGSIPGPTLRVRQGSQLLVTVRNDGDTDATVHWHGLRLDNAYDGVPFETQPPIRIGDEFTYRLRFPDAGLYWYHPHIREDYGLEMGLYGNIVVEPADSDYWPDVDREVVVTLDDVLVEDGAIAPFREAGPTHVAMGRYGNVMLVAGETDFALEADVGEVVRFFFTNTANTRLFDVGLHGMRMKLVGGDSGRYEHETFVDAVLLAPSERAVVDVHFERPGPVALEHRTPQQVYVLGTIHVAEEAGTSAASAAAATFAQLRTSDELTRWRRDLDAHLTRAPDKTLAFTSRMPLLYGDGGDVAAAATYQCPMHPEVTSDAPGACPKCGMQLVPVVSTGAHGAHGHPDHGAAHDPARAHSHDHAEPGDAHDAAPGDAHDAAPGDAHDAADGLEWEDLMPEINAASDAHNMLWKIVDVDTGKENGEIDWTFRVGDLVKIRLVNGPDQDHPMHHPFHIHGAGRFLVLARDGVVEPNLVWKDTVLVRSAQTVDILFEVTNPGLWMAHCHIAEHNQGGMMFSFPVLEA